MLLLLFFSATAFGQVGINTTAPNSKAALDVVSKNNNTGILITRLTTAQRDAIGATSTEDGLTIYNTDEKCYNYYQSTNATWLSLCGTYQKSTYTANCTSIKAFGTYTQGTSLNNSNYITMSVTVTKIGTYSIIAKTTNGYYFEKSGVFPNTGTFTITLDGSGAPVTGPQTDTLSFVYDGTIDTTCTSKTISVLGSQVSYGITCGSAVVSGTYAKGIQLDYTTNTVTIPLSNVDTAGTVSISTATNNGVSFNTTQAITTSSTSITLHGVGTPTSAGMYTFTFTTNGANPQTCTFNVTFITTLGTFTNPGNRCLDIYNDGQTTDGYYWVKDASTGVFKTYCDMSNGGWTLIKSLSERQILVVEQTQSESFSTQTQRNAVTTQTGVFNEYAFSLSSATVNNVGSGTGTKQYRFSIKEKGQTGTTVAQVESTTVAPVNDYWAKVNYINATVTDGNLATSNYGNYGNTTTGKLYGFDFGKPVTGNTLYQINGVPFVGYIPGLYSSANFFTGIYGGNGYASSSNDATSNLTYTYPTGQTFTFSKYYINDLFGIYQNSEQELNHHIGTCSNSTDDYGGASFCNAGWANWRPHNFNLRSGNYEGRIIQYWVK
jgi:hypothetical protein